MMVVIVILMYVLSIAKICAYLTLTFAIFRGIMWVLFRKDDSVTNARWFTFDWFMPRGIAWLATTIPALFIIVIIDSLSKI